MLQCGIQCVQKIGVAERFEKALYCSFFEQAWPDGIISSGGHKDDRNLYLSELQFSLEIEPTHAWHRDI